MGTYPCPRPWQRACLVIAAVSLGIAIHIRDGLVEPRAVAWLTVAVAFVAAGLMRLRRESPLNVLAGRWMTPLLVAGIATQFALLLTYRLPPAWHGAHPAWPYYALITAAGLLVAGIAFRVPLAFPLLLVTFALTGVWVLRVGQLPRMDVWVAQTAGLKQLLHGGSPWTSTFPDVYGIPDLYAPGTVRDGVVHLGFPYPPLTVLLDLPGHLLFGDYRYSNLAAMVAAAALIGYSRPGATAKLAAALFLFTPRAFLVLRNGWTEPQVAMLLAAVVFCACRRPRAMPYALGLLLVSKQFMFVAAGASALLMSRHDWRRVSLRAAVAGAAVSLPLVAWDLPAYWQANFAAAASAKFRYDALSFFAYWANVHDWTPPGWIGGVAIIAAVVATLAVLRRADRTPAGFAAAVALVFLAFFSLNKFAFCNYYYFVISALAAGIACGSAEAGGGAFILMRYRGRRGRTPRSLSRAPRRPMVVEPVPTRASHVR